MTASPLAPELLDKMDAYWRAANYLSVAQIYLLDNPLLKRPLMLADVKHMLLGHWGTTPGQNFIYVHLNRVIKQYDLDMIYVSGPGHGGPAVVGNTYLEGTYSEIYPEISQDEAGLQRLFKQFSFPGGIPSHASPECPGSIHEGGELGYSLSHAFGAVFDNPDLIVACVVGDGEAETGPLATAWHSNKFLDPVTDGVVLPILHLNGYKIANPTILARIEPEELEQFLLGCGWTPYFVEGDEPERMHAAMATTLDRVLEQIKDIQHRARSKGDLKRPRWPMIVLNSPKGWTGPKWVDGLPIEGSFRAHQVPIAVDADHPEHLQLLEDWLKSYRPEELFDGQGRLRPELAELAPKGERRMGANPHANGGLLLRDLVIPDFRDYAVKVPSPGSVTAADTHELGVFLRDVTKANQAQRNFRIFGPDETLSNRLNAVFEVTNRQWDARTWDNDEFLAREGRVMEMLSEHQCQGWLEGYLLTGRHGLFNSYEAFVHIIDSMFNQHAKWLKVTLGLPWRRKIASLNYLLASHVWQQMHNGFTHQDPGFIDHVVNKKASIVRVYLPPDANCLLSVWDHCLRSRHYVNVVIAGKYQAPQWLSMDAAAKHCSAGVGIWRWASNDEGNDQDAAPDVVMACCGDVPTLETLAAVSILRRLPARAEDPRGQRRRPVQAGDAQRAPPRLERRRFRRAVYDEQAGHLCVPWLPLADPPADLPAHQSRQLPCPRLQGRGHHHHALRHARAERSGPLPPRHGQADRAHAVHRKTRAGSTGDPRLDVAGMTAPWLCRGMRLCVQALLLGSCTSRSSPRSWRRSRSPREASRTNPSAPQKKSSRWHPRRWMSNPSRKMKRSASGSKPCWTPPTGSPTRRSGSRKASSFSAVRWSPMSLENGLAIWHAIRRTSSPSPTGLRCPNRRLGISARRRAVSLHSGATSSARCRSCFSDCSSWHCRWGAAVLATRGVRALLRQRVRTKLLQNVIARAAGGFVVLCGVYLILRVSGLTQLALTLVGGTGLIGLVLGIAFRDITENFLSSIFLSIQRPFETGDLVEISGVTGYVQQLNMRTTILMTLDGNLAQIPNASVYKSILSNFTTNANRREDFVVGIGYDDAINEAQEIARKVLADHPAVLNDPEPSVLADSLGSATVNLRVYFWLNGREHSWLKVRSSVIRLVKLAFQNQGISMPDEAREVVFPQGVPVTMLAEKPAEGAGCSNRQSGSPPNRGTKTSTWCRRKRKRAYTANRASSRSRHGRQDH
jgi:xylulose-5-phosphate/fructose-6-phosphate phosphoketolase